MPIVYATDDALTDWIGVTPDTSQDVPTLLRQASILVGRACRNDLYDVDSSGKPSDPDLVEAMRDATCAQVEAWLAVGVDPVAGVGGLTAVKTETTVDGATVKYDTVAVAAAAQAKVASVDTLNPTALAILRSVGLASGLV
jgi:hypothetical protein